MNPTAKLPQRLTERAFRRYEHVLAFIVRNYPDTVDLSRFVQGSALTFSARLRDAKTSFAKFHWPSAIIDRNKFDQVESDIVVRHNAEHLEAGSRTSASSVNLPAAEQLMAAEDVVPSTPFQVTYELATFICHLASQKCLSKPIKVIGLSDTDVVSLEENWDVRIDKQSDESYTIL